MQRTVEKVKEVNSIPKWVDQAIDVEALATKLQAVGIMDCQQLPNETVQYAAAQWFSSMVDAIEQDPEWFIEKFQTNKFRDNIPYLDEL